MLERPLEDLSKEIQLYVEVVVVFLHTRRNLDKLAQLLETLGWDVQTVNILVIVITALSCNDFIVLGYEILCHYRTACNQKGLII